LEFTIPAQRYGFIEIDNVKIIDSTGTIMYSFEAESYFAKKEGGFEVVYRSNAEKSRTLHLGSDNTKDTYPGEKAVVTFPLNTELKPGKYELQICYSLHNSKTLDKMTVSLVKDSTRQILNTCYAPAPTGDWNKFSEFTIPIQIQKP
jgi:hypothetical protein